MNVAVRALALALGVGLAPVIGSAQTLPVGDVREEYLRLLQVRGLATAGSYLVRPVAFGPGVGVADSLGHPWGAAARWGGPGAPAPAFGGAGFSLRADPARVRLFGNSALPLAWNDGAVWQGKGLTAALDAGATLEAGPLTVTLHPVLTWAQNGAFELAPVTREGANEYAYPWRRIDLPQRYGPDAFARLDPGESTVSLSAGGFEVGASTRNLWWGPGRETSILMSNHAAGFLHGFVGTSRPVDIGIGTLEGQWVWGWLEESGWYTEADAGQGRFLTGAAASFSPEAVPGLSVGGARVFVTDIPDGGLAVGDYFAVLSGGFKKGFATPENPTGEDESDQLLSLFIRWVFPESGLETYLEWGRNDHAWDLDDFLAQPEHAQAYLLGFQKVGRLEGGRLLAFAGELVNVERSRTFQVRPSGGVYAHHKIWRGYTNRGQVIGSLVGPGGNGSWVSADVYEPWGSWGLQLLRYAHDNDRYYSLGRTAPFGANHVSLGVLPRALVRSGGIEWGGQAGFVRVMNVFNDTGRRVWNLHASVSATWRPQ